MADYRPANDETIPNDERLYVRIYPQGDCVKHVEGNNYRPTGGGLRRYPDEPLSVDLGSRCTPEDTRTRGTDGNFHVALLIAGEVRALGCRISRDPVTDGPVLNPAHALIHGPTKTDDNGDLRGALTQTQFSKLARSALIIVWAPGWNNGQPPAAQPPEAAEAE